MQVNFEENRMIQNIQKFWAFWQKMVNNLWETVDAILTFLRLSDAKVLIDRLSSSTFPKIMVVRHV